MISARPWRADAVVRLLLSVLVCVYCGALVESTLHYGSSGGKGGGALVYLAAAAGLVCLGTALALLRKAWPTETALRRLTGAFGCVGGGFVLGAWVQKCAGTEEISTRLTLISSLSSHGAIIVLVACLLREQGVGWAEGFGFGNRMWLAAVFGALAAVVLYAVALGLDAGVRWLFEKLPGLGVEPKVQEAVKAVQQAANWPSRLALTLMALVLAPVGEELLFRGVLYPAIKQAGYPRLALWGTAVFFAVIHVNIVLFLPLLVLALALTMIYEWTDNLLAPIVAHGVFNGLNLAVLFLAK